MRRFPRGALVLLGFLGVALALMPMAAAIEAASPVQRAILELFFLILVFALLIGVLVHLLLLAAVAWFRDSPKWRPPKGAPRTHDKRLEIGWTVGPVVILVLVAGLTWATLNEIERPPTYEYGIEVIGVQWAWSFVYPDWNATYRNISSSGTMYIEEGVTFLLNVTAPGPNNVIHSFYVPALGIKIDAVPGRTNYFWVRADIPGTYTVNCAEFCGIGHSGMNGEVVVFPRGSQAVPYGPPPSAQPPPPPGTGLPVDIEFIEAPGPCAPTQRWSLKPCSLQLGRDADITLRIWNNGTTDHGFQMFAPYPMQSVQLRAGESTVMNFRTTVAAAAVRYICFVSGHEDLGMFGFMNVSAPLSRDISLSENSVVPAQLDFGLGANVTITVHNVGSTPLSFDIGPPYSISFGTVGIGLTATQTIVFNRSVEATWFGGAGPGNRGTLRVSAEGAVTTAPPVQVRLFPVLEVTVGTILVSGVAAVWLNWKLARAAKKKETTPPEELD